MRTESIQRCNTELLYEREGPPIWRACSRMRAESMQKCQRELLYRGKGPPIWRALSYVCRINQYRNSIRKRGASNLRGQFFRRLNQYTNAVQKNEAINLEGQFLSYTVSRDCIAVQKKGASNLEDVLSYAYSINTEMQNRIAIQRGGASNLEGVLSYVYRINTDMQLKSDRPPMWRVLFCIQNQYRSIIQKRWAFNLEGHLFFCIAKPIKNCHAEERGLQSEGANSFSCIESIQKCCTKRETFNREDKFFVAYRKSIQNCCTEERGLESGGERSYAYSINTEMQCRIAV